MRKCLCIIVGAAILLAALSGSAVFGQDKPAVAIMPFKEGQLTYWWSWDWALAEGVTQLVTDAVVKQNRLTVVERTRVSELIGEQDLGDEGRIEAETASQIGKLLGARLLVMGTITEFQFRQTGGIGFGPLRVAGSQATVKLTGRVVDSETGRILGSFEGSGSNTGASFAVDNFKGVSLEGEQFQGSTLGKATMTAVNKFVAEMTKICEEAASQVAKSETLLSQSGSVAAVLPGDQIVVTLGSKHGMKLNTILNITHLQTIQGLKDPVRIPVGQAKVISVDNEASVARIESKTQDIQVGDVVTRQ